MRIDCKDKTTLWLIEQFEALYPKGTSHVEDRDIVEVEVTESDINKLGYKSFIDLAQIFFMKMLTPFVEDESVILRFQKLIRKSSFHNSLADVEKYGVGSEFFKIDKTSHVSFLYYYIKALKALHVEDCKRVLNLGINRGDEFRVIKDIFTCEVPFGYRDFEKCEFVGVDYSSSAIEFAKKSMNEPNVRFICADINDLSELELGKFDMLISIGTLQSSSLNFNETFMKLFQNYLEKGASVLLGFPNCRWIDGEMIYGAKAPNYSFSELSLVLKDIHFCKKYLQQKKYRVTITGKDYLFLSAVKI